MKLGLIHQIAESRFQVWDFIYKDYTKDPSPRALILGAFDNKNTGNRLVAAVNTRLLSTGEAKRLHSILDQIKFGSTLQERVKILKNLSVDIFDKAYRTYDSNKMVSVKKNFVYTDNKSYEEVEKDKKRNEKSASSKWSNYGNDSYGLSINDPSVGKAEATLKFLDNRSGIYVDMFNKNKNASPGAGKALLREIINSTKKYSPEYIEGHFTSTAALGALGSEFGKNNIKFRNRTTGEPANITFDAAMGSPEKYIARAVLVEDDNDLNLDDIAKREPVDKYERRDQEDNKVLQGTNKDSGGELEKDTVEDPEYLESEIGGDNKMEYGKHRSNRSRNKIDSRTRI